MNIPVFDVLDTILTILPDTFLLHHVNPTASRSSGLYGRWQRERLSQLLVVVQLIWIKYAISFIMNFLGIKRNMASETKPKKGVNLKEVAIYVSGIVILIIIVGAWWIGAGSYYFTQPTATPQPRPPSTSQTSPTITHPTTNQTSYTSTTTSQTSTTTSVHSSQTSYTSHTTHT